MVNFEIESDNICLTEGDIKFLLGDEEYWPRRGAAMAVTDEFCRNSGYGLFGKPTEKGKKAIAEYRKRHTL